MIINQIYPPIRPTVAKNAIFEPFLRLLELNLNQFMS